MLSQKWIKIIYFPNATAGTKSSIINNNKIEINRCNKWENLLEVWSWQPNKSDYAKKQNIRESSKTERELVIL